MLPVCSENRKTTGGIVYRHTRPDNSVDPVTRWREKYPLRLSFSNIASVCFSGIGQMIFLF